VIENVLYLMIECSDSQWLATVYAINRFWSFYQVRLGRGPKILKNNTNLVRWPISFVTTIGILMEIP
jgi:hypothetical protein